MTMTIPGAIALGAVLALLPSAARPGGGSVPGARAGTEASPAAPVLLAQANEPEAKGTISQEPTSPESASPESSSPESTSPPTTAPTTPPPPDTAAPPPDTAAPRSASPERSAPPGQWVYTQQYGWIWMPYADAYTYLPPEGYGEPYMYVYAPAYGWSWMVAPWVWGWGPWPYFGIHGAWHFGWYGHGWWGYPGWRGHPGWWGHPWRGSHRAVPFRRGVPIHGVVPAPRPARPLGPGAHRPVARPPGGSAAPRRR